MNVRPIRTEADYEWALAEIELYFDKEPQAGSPEADRCDVLATLIEAYEDREWKIDAPTPVEVIREVMAASGRSQSDFADLLGSRARASEILHGKRKLTVDMIHRISTVWNIPADLLVTPSEKAGRAA